MIRRMPNKLFPLIIWENTEECEKEYEEAQKKFHDIYTRLVKKNFRCTYLGGLRFDCNGFPEVFLNDNKGYKNEWNLEEAITRASERGDCGWWNLDELEEFVNGKGVIFEEAMWDLGYRRNKRDNSKWAKLSSKEKGRSSPLHHQHWQGKYGKTFKEISDEERNRLNGLLVLQNKWAGLDKTYAMQSGKRGMIYLQLEYSPFYGGPSEGLGSYYGPREANRGHIAKQQRGFCIEAQNIELMKPTTIIRDEGIKEEIKEGIYIKAVKPDGNYVECVWPAQIQTQNIYDLADNLVSRVLGGQPVQAT